MPFRLQPAGGGGGRHTLSRDPNIYATAQIQAVKQEEPVL